MLAPIPLERFCKKGWILRYTIIVIISLLLLMAIIIPSVILTRRSPSNSPNLDTETIAPSDMRRPTKKPTMKPTKKPTMSPSKVFMERLKPLLTNKSREELKRPFSSESFALEWLLTKNSNFSYYTFDRQVQRFAMALLYHSTGGNSWKEWARPRGLLK